MDAVPCPHGIQNPAYRNAPRPGFVLVHESEEKEGLEGDLMKTFVLDTNVLLHNSSAIFAFGKNKVVIPITVIEELDRFKSFSDEKGRHARAAARYLDELRGQGCLHEGVPLPNGGMLYVVSVDAEGLPKDFEYTKKDNLIIAAALKEHRRGGEVIFVTKDINARIKANALGIRAEDFESNKVNIDELYTGWREMELSGEQYAFFRERGFLDGSRVEGLCSGDTAPYPNEFFIMRCSDGDEEVLYGRYAADGRIVRKLQYDQVEPWGIRPLNPQQKFALEALLDVEVQLVTLVGCAGTGKTLLAVAAGLNNVIDERIYRRMLVSRPIMPLGRDIGYLPGSKDEKLNHWMQPIFDNLEYIFSNNWSDAGVKPEDQLEMLLESKKIELEALTYIRGRSIPHQYLVIDEAQNLTPHEIKTIITRAGDGTKVVLTGDPYQIDNPYLDSASNGLTTVVERFKGQPLFAHVTFVQSERSPLSSLAAELL